MQVSDVIKMLNKSVGNKQGIESNWELSIENLNETFRGILSYSCLYQ